MSLLTAILTATVFAAFGFPYRYYQCWYSWGRFASLLASLAYFVIAGGGGGLLGWLVGQLTNAHPKGNPAVDGFLFGAGAAVTLRADFRPPRYPTTKPPRRSAEAGDEHGSGARSAASLLAVGLTWTGGALDDISRRHVQAWLTGQDDRTLRESAYGVYALIRQDPNTPDRAKEITLTLLVRATEQIRNGDESQRFEGRAHAITFCTKYYLQEHLPRPLRPERRVAEEASSP